MSCALVFDGAQAPASSSLRGDFHRCQKPNAHRIQRPTDRSVGSVHKRSRVGRTTQRTWDENRLRSFIRRRGRQVGPLHLTRPIPVWIPTRGDERRSGRRASGHQRRRRLYYWIERGHLGARRAPNGRLCVSFTAEVEAMYRRRIADSHHLRTEFRNLPLGEAA